jgi:hypothetical protein
MFQKSHSSRKFALARANIRKAEISHGDLKNLQNELQCRLESQTLLLCRRHPRVLNGVDPAR